MRLFRSLTRAGCRLGSSHSIPLATLAVCLVVPSLRAQAPQDSDAAMHRFVAGLMAKMTLAEKIGQMSQIARHAPPVISHEESVRREQVGSFLFMRDPQEIDRLQHIAVEETRLHIPLVFGFDVVHGYRTIYPIPLAMAASWDPSVAEMAQHMAAREASAVGVRFAFGPMVDIARDARWGRIMEGAGEDPYLGSKMAAAEVIGFQGKKLGAPDSIMASVKHFAGYGATSGGRDYDESEISDNLLWNLYLPPFHAAEQAGAETFMAAYMNLNGVPASANAWLLNDVLRKQWGFKGFVVSDWETVPNLVTHGYAADAADAAARAVNAGVDMEMTSHDYLNYLEADVKSGKVSAATIDTAVRRILEAKYKLGLFQHPYAPEGAAERELVSPEQRHAAKLAAERTAVLLRNENGALPLKRDVRSIAVVGALADSKADTMGSWSLAGHYDDTVTILEGLRAKVGSSVEVRFARGVELERGNDSIFDPQFASPKPTLITQQQKDAAFAEAISTIKRSDVAVLVMGELQSMNGERASRESLDLPGDQERLLEAAVATGKPVVLVLLAGRPLTIPWASQHVPAILDAWYPGTEGGNAVADLLFGDANPGGKLPVTWPRSVGQEPLYYNPTLSQIPNDRDTMYWDGSNAPLYPFGYGLSYSKITVGGLKLSDEYLHAGGSLKATVTLHNESGVAGDQVVQLYVHQRAGLSARPVRELKGFERVTLQPGETRAVTIPVNAADLRYWSASDHGWHEGTGTFDVWVGDSSVATEHATFEEKP
ncbi:beta-glucosidase [Bryocella elongata]|uniref:beta-glucosidase n=1 Tax=Bryocella elongata TaxID=863522 RepID=A0A1H5VV15_9BACT|nr:beta-glucosidase BglX [Bryocella elongata]SEF90808.1 beta-glucosidase [Bryocella elongata]